MTTLATGSGPVVTLPKAGAGLSDSTSVNFLMIGSLLALLYLAGAWCIRRISGRHVELEDDGIQGI